MAQMRTDTGSSSGSDSLSGTRAEERYDTNRDAAELDDLPAIRTLLLAIARHNAIQIPPELLPARPRSNTGKVDLKRGHYDSIRTIDYQLRQLPQESLFAHDEWEEAFSLFKLSRPSMRKRETVVDRGLTNVLSWMIDERLHHNGTYVGYDEFGYDHNGYVCRAGRHQEAGPGGTRASGPLHGPSEIKEHIQLEAAESRTQSAPWVGQRFGREWILGLNGMCDETVLSIAAFQLCSDADLDETSEWGLRNSSRRRLAECFLTAFTGKWGLSRSLWGSSDHPWTGSTLFKRSSWEDVVFQYHMRVFTATPWSRPLGPGLQRVSGQLTDDKTTRILSMVEVRYSVGLKTTWRLDFPVFSLVTMADSIAAGGLRELGQLCDEGEWHSADMHPSVRATGIAAFAFRINSLLPQWRERWSCLIDGIDEIGKDLNADLDSILSRTRRREIMVDGRNLQISEFYFAVIQILRIAADWIQESMNDLRRMVDDMERLYLSSSDDGFATFLPAAPEDHDAAIQAFKQAWEGVISRQQRLGAALLARISKKQEETKSLRDGLFSATSVSEATKSTQLNHYILVFTVVTVIYQPLSFITALFTLGLFDWSNPRQITWFLIAILFVAGATYFFALLLIWAVRDPARRQAMTEFCARFDPRPAFNRFRLGRLERI